MKFLLLSLFLAIVTIANAANVYIRDGGSGDGSAWNNALDILPVTLVRGNTYYIADGTYPTHTFNDAESGTTLITIKKATVADHGTETGWNNSYGDGEALFTGSGPVWIINSGYWTFDGQFGAGRNPGGYGFRLKSTDSRESTTKAIWVDSNSSGITVNGCTLKYIEVDWNNGTAAGSSAVTRALDMGISSNSGWVVDHCFFHHSSGFHYFWNAGSNVTISNNYFWLCGGGGGVSAHWEAFWHTYISGLTFKNNVVDTVVGTGGQTGWLMIGGCQNVAIYGNLFCVTSAGSVTGNNGTIGTWSNDVYANTNVYIYNNTFVDLVSGGLADPKIYFSHNGADDTNVRVQNNLIFCTAFGVAGADTNSHNAFGGGASGFGSNAQTGITSAIFTNYGGDVFTLASNTTPGTALGAPYNIDMLGNARSTWSRGAFEFSTGGGSPFASDGSRADTQAKIDLAADGDTVTLPAGSFTWTSGVTVAGKGIKIKGAGSARIIARSTSSVAIGTGTKTWTLLSARANTALSYLNISAGQTLRIWRTGGSDSTPAGTATWMQGTVNSYNSGTAALSMNITSTSGGSASHGIWIVMTNPTTTVVNNTGGGIVFDLKEDTTHNVELSDIYFTTVTASSEGSALRMDFTSGGKPVLIHDCSILLTHSAGAPFGIRSTTNRGVIWNCSFFGETWLANPVALSIKSNGLASSWATVSSMGTTDAAGDLNVYIENCDFHAFLNSTDFDDGSRVVARRNLLNNSGYGSHGHDSSPIGVRHYEVYDNEWIFNNLSPGFTFNLGWWFLQRGGTGVFTGNIIPTITSSDYGNRAALNMGVWALCIQDGSWGAGAMTISGNTAAASTVITTTSPHLLTNGVHTRIYNSNSTPNIDGKHVVTVISPTTFSIPVTVTVPGTTGKSNPVNYYQWRQFGYGYVTGAAGNDPDGYYKGDIEPFYAWNNSQVPTIGLGNGGAQPTDPDLVEDYIIANREYYLSAKPGWSRSTYPNPWRTDANQVASPLFSPVAGSYGSAQSVTITSATAGASIRYTVNGSTPTSASGTVYSSPVSISTTTTLKAIAYNGVLTDSTVTNGVYTIAGQVAAPTFSPVAGSYGSAQSVTITSATGGATIRYTVDGSTPTSSSGTVYASPVSISVTTTLKAIAYNGVLPDSGVTSGVYTITGQVSDPVFNPVAGIYGSAQSVAITSATGGASIRFTVDGSTPTSSSGTVYSAPVNIAATATLKAIAYNGVLPDSSVTTGLYTITTDEADLTVAGTVTVTGTLALPP